MNGGKRCFTENMVVDTTVWVHLFRRDGKARDFLLGLGEEIVVSRTTVMEIIYGGKSRQDISNMWNQFRSLGVIVKEIDEGISVMAGEIFEEYFPTRGIGLMDTFVAATAVVNGWRLATHNKKHFDFIEGLELVVPY